MIKMIVMDMDGTLLTSDNIIDEVTKQALIALEKKGVRLVLASGRSYKKLMQYAEELEMQNYGGYLLEVNGLAQYDLEKQERKVKTHLTYDEVNDFFLFGKKYEIEMQALFDDGMYIHIPDRCMPEKIAYRTKHQLPDDYPWTRGALTYMHDNRMGYPKQTYLKDISEINCPINKVCFADEKPIIDNFVKNIRAQFKDRFWMGKTTESWLEIMPKGITKGAALIDLANDLNIAMDEILVFGDGENDIEMLSAVNYGIAMENALANVKEYAYDITDDNNHQGIAKALQKYIG